MFLCFITQSYQFVFGFCRFALSSNCFVGSVAVNNEKMEEDGEGRRLCSPTADMQTYGLVDNGTSSLIKDDYKYYHCSCKAYCKTKSSLTVESFISLITS